MNVLLDTHIFLWGLSEPTRIPKEKRAAVESLANTIYVSSISIVEIMIKTSIGKLTPGYPWDRPSAWKPQHCGHSERSA